MKNVLVFPCGSEIGLEVNRALAGSTHFSLFGASSVNDHGKVVYKNYIADLPLISAVDFIDKINLVIAEHDIDFIIPAHDSVVLKLAENRPLINVAVITSCAETCRLCRSKRRTYELFAPLLPTPEIYTETEEMTFPVFLKPDVGQGSRGTYKVNSLEEITFYCKQNPTLLALEYLPGKEYTVDCFTDRNGALLFAEGRERIRTCNGISVNSKQTIDARFQKMAHIINKNLSLQGVWFYQVKERSSGELVLMEIAPRMAGTMALFRADGVNFISLSLFDRMNKDVSILRNHLNVEIDRALSTHFLIQHDYDCVYIDFDDTIIVNNQVNTTVIQFLYQSRNTGKRIVLLSRHKKDIQESLKNFSISERLFDEVIILKDHENKYDYITNRNAVFIDDSFTERKAVLDTCHIPVFALDAVSSLLDWSI